jgi:SPP1 family holin
LDKMTIARMLVFLLGWINAGLVAKGFKPIPVLDEGQIAFGVAFVISLYTTIKHNFFGKKGKKQKEAIKSAV